MLNECLYLFSHFEELDQATIGNHKPPKTIQRVQFRLNQ